LPTGLRRRTAPAPRTGHSPMFQTEMRYTKSPNCLLCVGAFTFVAALTACGQTGGDTPPAAKVNGDAISMQALNSLLARNGTMTPEQQKAAAPQALKSMVEQQLLVQKALATKLDNDPQTALALENARKQILAQAYLDKALSTIARPSSAEVSDFYEKNPALFAQRRVYRFQELGAPLPEDKFDELQRFSQKVKYITEVGNWFKERSIPFKAMDNTKAAEELPLELLPELARLNDGQIAVLRSTGRVAVLQLVQSRPAPLDMKQATAYIEQYLLNRKRMDAAKVEVKGLVDSAKVEYFGEYASAAAK